MKKNIVCLAITSCFVFGSAVAHASPSSQGTMDDQMFKAMDTNSDGMVTREEFNKSGANEFTKMDVNFDGQITAEERNAVQKTVEGSGTVRNKMNDEGKDPKGKERSTNMSGDMEHTPIFTDSDRSPSERTKSPTSRKTKYGEAGGAAGDAAVREAAAPGKVLKQDRLKIENRDQGEDPTGTAAKSSSPSGS